VVVYQRTIYGLPVWQEGVSVTLNEDLDVISSSSTLRKDEDARPPAQNDEFIKEISKDKLKKLLGLADTEPSLHVNRQRLIEYRFNYKAREQKDNLANLDGPLPQPMQLELNKFNEGRYYASMEVLFTLGDVNWKAFVEVETGMVLYLRAHVARLHGHVYTMDPLTRLGAIEGPKRNASLHALNGARQQEELLAFTAQTDGVQRQLVNQYIRIVENAPSGQDGNFTYNADSPQFAAVNAYYHLTVLFQLLGHLGFDYMRFFAKSILPLRVFHYNIDMLDAMAYGNAKENGLDRFVFGVAIPGRTIGNACDFRLVAHEFCHALLYGAIESPNFTFAHSAGDALGSIFCDPLTRLEGDERFTSFPWLYFERHHNRRREDGWAWGGVRHDGQYNSEQILNTTLFRAYQCIGGDAEQFDRRQWASRYMLHLIIAGMAGLPPFLDAPLQDATTYVTAMMQADNGMIMGFPGGAVYKVIYWSFEEQGLYQPHNENRALMVQRGTPEVDVYINDGREGHYNITAEWKANPDIWKTTPDIWNRRADDRVHLHQPPLRGAVNFCYVRIKNRGTQIARNVLVSAYRKKINRDTNTWPTDFKTATDNTPYCIYGQNIGPGGESIVGPFEWTPSPDIQHDSILITVSATGDLSNIDAYSRRRCAQGPIDIDKLVPFDNNISLRVMDISDV
jgi:hypothetical protein